MAGRSGRILCDEQEELRGGLLALALGQNRELPPTPALRVAYRHHP